MRGVVLLLSLIVTVAGSKPGQCPNDLPNALTPTLPVHHVYCTSDYDCHGDLKCCNDVCSPPVCTNDATRAICTVNPCDVLSCLSDPVAVCFQDPCSDVCEPLWFTQDGDVTDRCLGIGFNKTQKAQKPRKGDYKGDIRLHNAHKKRIKLGRWLDRKAEHIQRRHQHAQTKRNNRKQSHKNKQQQFWRDIKQEMRFAKKAMKAEFSELTKEMIQAKRQEIIAAKRLEKATREAELEEKKLSAIDEQIKEREHSFGNDAIPIPNDVKEDSIMDKKERSLAKIHTWLKKYKPRRHHKNGKTHHE